MKWGYYQTIQQCRARRGTERLWTSYEGVAQAGSQRKMTISHLSAASTLYWVAGLRQHLSIYSIQHLGVPNHREGSRTTMMMSIGRGSSWQCKSAGWSGEEEGRVSWYWQKALRDCTANLREWGRNGETVHVLNATNDGPDDPVVRSPRVPLSYTNGLPAWTCLFPMDNQPGSGFPMGSQSVPACMMAVINLTTECSYSHFCSLLYS